MDMLKTMVVVACLSMQSAFAGIPEEVKTLQKLAMGGDGVQLSKSRDANELFKNFIMAEHGEFETERLVNKEIDEMSFGDEIDYGFTSTKSAIAMAGFAEGQIEEVLDNVYDDEAKARELKAQIYDLNKGWAPAIKRLERQGAKFGYDGHGPGYCGISFIRLLVLDPKTNKVHMIYLSESGPC